MCNKSEFINPLMKFLMQTQFRKKEKRKICFNLFIIIDSDDDVYDFIYTINSISKVEESFT